MSHYIDSAPTKLLQGLRSDGKAPSAYIADTTTANAQVGKGAALLCIEQRPLCALAWLLAPTR